MKTLEEVKDDRTIKPLTDQVYWFVFNLIDSHPDFTGLDAGRLASMTERLFARTLQVILLGEYDR